MNRFESILRVHLKSRSQVMEHDGGKGDRLPLAQSPEASDLFV